MIQVYLPDNNTYSRNGDLVLHPMECLGDFHLNGTWELTMITPLDGSQDYLMTDAVIKAPAPNGDQLYRIYKVEPNLEYVTSYAVPIFMQAAQDCFFMDIRPTNVTGQQYMDYLMTNTIYSGISNVVTSASAYYIRKNLIECLMSNEDNSFLNRWGGEVYFDNYTITINQRIGQDRGVKVKLGQNMTGCEVRIDSSNVVTRIIPIAYNGYLLESPYYVDSPRISSYPFVRTRLIRYENMKLASDAYGISNEEVYDTLAELQDAMTAKAEAEFTAGADLPKVTYHVSVADLAATQEYKDISSLMEIHLGDTVSVENPELMISTSARCIELVWNFITESPEEIVLGDYEEDYFSRLTQQQSTLNRVLNIGDQTVNAEAVAGILNAMQTQLRLQNTVAEKSDVRAILFEDTDPNSALYGAMSIGTQGFQIAKSQDVNGDWIWSTFGTAQGFSADLIIAGILYSQNYVQGLQGLKIDLNNGTIEAPQLVLNITSEASASAVAEISEEFGDTLSDLDSRVTTNEGNISGNSSEISGLKSRVSSTEKVTNNVANYFVFDDSGLYVGGKGSAFKTRTNNYSFSILNNGIEIATFSADGIDTKMAILSDGLLMPPLQLTPYDNGWIVTKAGD